MELAGHNRTSLKRIMETIICRLTDAYGNGVWVGVGEEKIAWSVDDGATWHFKRMENKNWKRVAFGNGRFVVIADSMGGCCSSSSSNAMHSVDGISWNEIASDTDNSQNRLVKT